MPAGARRVRLLAVNLPARKPFVNPDSAHRGRRREAGRAAIDAPRLDRSGGIEPGASGRPPASGMAFDMAESIPASVRTAAGERQGLVAASATAFDMAGSIPERAMPLRRTDAGGRSAARPSMPAWWRAAPGSSPARRSPASLLIPATCRAPRHAVLPRQDRCRWGDRPRNPRRSMPPRWRAAPASSPASPARRSAVNGVIIAGSGDAV
jgi:hypothetical protein